MSIEQKLQGLFESDMWDLEKEKKRLQETHDGLPKIVKELVEMTGIEESQLLRLAVWTARNEHPVKWYEVLSVLHTFYTCKRTAEKDQRYATLQHVKDLLERNEQLEQQLNRITLIFEEKVKTSEANIAQLTKHRDRAYAGGHLTESYDRELARWQEKHHTLTALWQEIQGNLPDKEGAEA